MNATKNDPVVKLTAVGERCLQDGYLELARSKHDQGKPVRYPEAVPAIQTFGSDPRGLKDLLGIYDSLKLGLSGGPGCVYLSLSIGYSCLAEITLPYPEYLVGMGATEAAVKAGVL